MILIENIYYMLSYAFQVLKEDQIREMDTEAFDNGLNLCAELLIKGISVQIKRGLKRDYVSKSETMSAVKGRIDVSASIKTQSLLRRQVVCTYDEFSTDTQPNEILKTTLIVLLRSDIPDRQKKEIRKLLVFFADVKEIDIHSIQWNTHYSRNDQSYQFLITVCWLVLKGLLQTQKDGSVKMMDFFDEQRMSHLYEKFILEYYRKHYPDLKANPSPIEWQLEGEKDSMLPMMKTDIMLQKDNDVLIIDAKYYSHNTQEQFDKHTIHSGNLYQIFTYVKNKEYELRDKPHKKVTGVLLYAQTDEDIQPNNEYIMSGNRICVKTLNLQTDFYHIKSQLNEIAEMLNSY